jgi:hypothetical protein
MVREEAHRKFGSNRLGPYKVILAALIGTYGLQDCHGSILRNPIHGQRLAQIPINHSIDTATGRWKSFANQWKRLGNKLIESTPELRRALDRDKTIGFSYK